MSYTPPLPNPAGEIYFQGWSAYEGPIEVPNWTIISGAFSSTRPRKLTCVSATFIPLYVKNFSLGFRVFDDIFGDFLNLAFPSGSVTASISSGEFIFNGVASNLQLGSENYIEVIYDNEGLHFLVDGLYYSSATHNLEELVTIELSNGTFSDFYLSKSGRVGPCRIYQAEINSETTKVNFSGGITDVDELIRDDTDYIESIYEDFQYFVDIKTPLEGVPAYYNYKARTKGSEGRLVIKNGLKEKSLKIEESSVFQWTLNVASRDYSVV